VKEQPPVVVTSAGRSGTADRRLRQRRYAQTQALRLLCFILAVALPVPLWAKLVLIAGAFVLPWLGVVAANAGPAVERTRTTALVERPAVVRIALEPGRDVDAT
jgi:threonine/homoserine/homoserine lactone efflux protein